MAKLPTPEITKKQSVRIWGTRLGRPTRRQYEITLKRKLESGSRILLSLWNSRTIVRKAKTRRKCLTPLILWFRGRKGGRTENSVLILGHRSLITCFTDSRIRQNRISGIPILTNLNRCLTTMLRMRAFALLAAKSLRWTKRNSRTTTWTPLWRITAGMESADFWSPMPQSSSTNRSRKDRTRIT